jgi:hypothetical protein
VTPVDFPKRKQQWVQLYERYGKPLEKHHRGEYLAVSPEGKTILAPTLLEALQSAKAAWGSGSFLYKVGQRTVGRV